VDTADPVRALKHESVHALKELGFFTPAQWQSLVKQANTTWINTYMRNRDVDGNYLQPGQQSRYDAYIDVFKRQGLDDAAIQEAMVEEAIADAFGDFAVAKEKPGMIRALINRMKNFFQSIKESVGLAEVTPERLFARVERGEVAPPAAPAKAAEVKREEPVAEEVEKPKAEEKPAEEPKEEAPKYSLRGEVPLSTRTIMEANDDFARADLGLNIKPKRGIANKVRDIGIALNEQTKREQGQMDRQKLTLDNEVAIAKAIADEVAYQLTAGQRKTGTGLGWYSNNYPRAVKRLGNRFPELATNRHARSVFTALVAVTSNGEKVNKNIDNAITLYAKLRNGEPMFAMGNRRATALVTCWQSMAPTLRRCCSERSRSRT
jgi:outer membrane biosynthesis protein TonB